MEIKNYAQYQQSVRRYIPTSRTRYEDLVHLIGQISETASHGILAPFRSYLQLREPNSRKLDDFDIHILTRELGHIQGMAAAARLIVNKLIERLSDGALTRDLQVTLDLKLEMSPFEGDEPLYAPESEMQLPIVNHPSLLNALYAGSSAIALLSSNLHYSMIDRGPMSIKGNELCIDPMLDSNKMAFRPDENDSSDLQMAGFLLSPIICAPIFASQAVSSLHQVIILEALAYRLVERLEKEFPVLFNQKRVWALNISSTDTEPKE